jgi:feruloyl esterase
MQRVYGIAFALAALASHGALAATSCEDLKNVKLQDTRVRVAESITPNPEWKYPPSQFDIFNTGPKGASKPFCRVALTIEKQIEVEVWLPKDWNGRFQGVGNGGYLGDFNFPAAGVALAQGYAAATTDVGHKAKHPFDSGWVKDNPQAVADFGHRAHHLMAVIGKDIVKAHYGKPADRAYYSGCSSGGWQGLTEAQKYPEDYDGIVAGAPATNFSRLQAHGILVAQLDKRDPAGKLDAAAGGVLVAAAVAKCDANDGVKDGVIDRPDQCNFDPAETQCKAGQSGGCLSAAQVARAKQFYGRRKSPGGLQLYPGAAFGAPPIPLLPGPAGTEPVPPLILTAYGDKGPGWTMDTFDPDKHLIFVEQRFDPDLGARKTDLGAFQKRGGKLILYHGWADELLSPYNSIDYYEAVEKKMGRENTAGFARLFMVPGMAHCAGGPGPNTFDAVAAMVKWVEEGTAPAQLIATHVDQSGKRGRTRPLCPYPQAAKYTGSGSTDDAADFRCSAP